MKKDKLKNIGKLLLLALLILLVIAQVVAMIRQYTEILQEPDGIETVVFSVLFFAVVFGIVLAVDRRQRRKRQDEDTKSAAYAGGTAQAESTGKANNRFLNAGVIVIGVLLVYGYVALVIFGVDEQIKGSFDALSYVIAPVLIVALVVLGLLRSRKTKASREQRDTYRHTRTEAQSTREEKEP